MKTTKRTGYTPTPEFYDHACEGEAGPACDQGRAVNPADLFQAVEGVRFVYAGRLVLSMHVGQYDNGRGAITLMEEGGSPYCVLTTNLPEVPLADDELLVGVRVGAPANEVRRAVAKLRLFTVEGVTVGSGFVPDYATVWKWRRCPGALSPTLASTEGDHRAGYAVQCPGCLRAIAETYEAEVDALLARDAERRLARSRGDTGYE